MSAKSRRMRANPITPLEDPLMFRRPYAAAVLAIGMILSLAGPSLAQAAIHLALGNPTSAVADAKTHPDNFFMDKGIFALSYNSKKGTANWVSWRLAKDDFRHVKRIDSFHADPDLPAPLHKVTENDYKGSGFDRGHMCPDADRNSTEEREAQTFTMTNMVPQSPQLNEQTWKMLEEHCRGLASAGKELYIIAGPFGQTGTGKIKNTGKEVTTATISGGAITVPSHCWKIVVVLDPGPEPAAARVKKDTQVIAVCAGRITRSPWARLKPRPATNS
jgi:endonuclease G, mitochondrial